MPKSTLQILEEGATLATANLRLARSHRMLFDDWQRASGKVVWPTAEIFSWSVLMNRLHQSSFAPEVVMNAHQETALWQQAIDEDGIELLDLPATAKAARRAWRLVETWNVPLNDPSFENHVDGKAFRRWVKRFESKARERGWITTAGQERAVANELVQAPNHLMLAGFDEFTPLQQQVLAKCRQLGTQLQEIIPKAEVAERVYSASFEDRSSEIKAAANWARSLLDRQPKASIGIIATGLAGIRNELDRALEQSLGKRAFNISLGLPLTQWPLSAAALLILQLIIDARDLSIEQWGCLLRSPFLYGAERERNERGQMEARLRRRAGMEVNPRAIPEGCPLLSKMLDDLKDQLQSLPRKQSMSGWARDFASILKTAGWPGERVLSSTERQTLAAWNEAVSMLTSLESTQGLVDRRIALDWLRRIATETIFQPETAEAPVQVLEGLQAAGSRFDAIWILGMDDRAWPAAAQPEPFLPRELQLRLELPHSSAEREYRFSQDLLERLKCSAPLLIGSHPLREGEEVLRPSGFLVDLDPWVEDSLQVDYWLEQRRIVEVEWLDDFKGPELEPGAIAGGSSLIKNTAECPFRGFAMGRLGASGLESPQPGLPPTERGTLLHTAMECFWNKIHSHANLVALSAIDRFDAIAEASRSAVEQHRKSWMSDRFTALEQSRIHKLLDDWLTREADREPFVVSQMEQKFEIDLDGVTIRLRIDRLDQLANGREVVIDYKSTAPSSKTWERDRLEEPQLPLYAVARSESAKGVVFAQLKVGEVKFQGLAEGSTGMGNSVKAPSQAWEVQLNKWREQLTGFAHELRTGYAAVSPTDDACKYCELPSLCRIQRESGGPEVVDE